MKSNVSRRREILRVAGVEALVDVPGHARDAELLAHVAAVPLPVIGSKTSAWA